MIFWRPIRKYLNVSVIPNIPFNFLRIFFYRIVGYKIGSNVFIGMKCYLDDLEPQNMIIEDGVVISYGCYFALHGRKQSRSFIKIKKKAYIGMRCNIIAKGNGTTIGENSIIGAVSLVMNDIPDNVTAYGNPAKVKRKKTIT